MRKKEGKKIPPSVLSKPKEISIICLSHDYLLKVNGWKEDEDGEGGESGTVFEDVDLTEKEWADYDERSADTGNYFHNFL